MEEEKDTDKAKEPTKEKDAGKKKEIKKPDASGEFLSLGRIINHQFQTGLSSSTQRAVDNRVLLF